MSIFNVLMSDRPINTIMDKKCNRCDCTKPLKDFSFRNDTQRYKTICRTCVNFRNLQRCKDPIKKEQKQRSQRKYANSDKGKANKLIYRNNSKEKRRIYCKNRWKNDPVFRMGIICRTRIKCALNGHTKGASSKELLGCTIQEYKKYLEKLFIPGMSWDNYGKESTQWSIDHILCCNLFDLTDLVQQKLCFHYSNTVPMWHSDNHRKGDKLDDGRNSRDLSKEEKLIYLRSKGLTV